MCIKQYIWLLNEINQHENETAFFINYHVQDNDEHGICANCF